MPTSFTGASSASHSLERCLSSGDMVRVYEYVENGALVFSDAEMTLILDDSEELMPDVRTLSGR